MPSFQQVLLLGTERAPQPPPAPHETLAQAWTALDWNTDRERALLDALALVTNACNAAALPAHRPAASPALPPAAPDTRPPAPAAAATLLPRLLENEFRPLLGEWLEACARAGYVLPHFQLPRALRSAANDPENRAAIAAVLGERGEWLLSLNPQWRALFADATPLPDSSWHEGSTQERLAWLRARRRTQAGAAREALRAAWKDEAADFREEALALLVEGLSSEDEGFLTTCLGDRSKGVRQVAQRLLTRLPGSALAGRMAERAAALVRVERGFLSSSLELLPPDHFDPAWKADAIEEKPPAGTGQKAYWARQILGCAPFPALRERSGLTTAKLCALADKSEWSTVFQEAWVASLEVWPDEELATELLAGVLRKHTQGQLIQHLPSVSRLLPYCNGADRWRLVLGHDNARDLLWSFLPVLGPLPGPAEAEKLLHCLAPSLREGTYTGGAGQALRLACLLPPTLREEAARLLQRESGLTRTAEQFLSAFDLRAAIQAAFAPAPARGGS